MKKNTTLVFFFLFFGMGFFKCLAQIHPSAKIVAAVCDNEDFEAGPGGAITGTAVINGWNTFKLITPSSPLVSNCAILTSTAVTKTNPTSAFLFTANGHVDTLIGAGYPIYSVFGSGSPNGGNAFDPAMPTMYGNSFFRIGDASGTPYNHHSIEKTIAVTSANALFRFAYISVVKIGTSCCDAPSVQVKFFNASQGNTLMPCPVYSVNAPISGCNNTTTPVMIASTATSIPSLGAYYHKWKIVAVDLSPYIGSNITFKMAVTYCSAGCSKYGYAYLDAQCSPMEIFVNNIPFPANTNSVTFSGCNVPTATVVAPPDFSSYQWTGPAGFTSTMSTITTSASGVYTLNIFTSGTCSMITKYVNIKLFPAATVSASTSSTLLCKGNTAKLTASGLSTYTWTPSGNTATINVTPTITTTYTVSGTDINGCFASTFVTQSVASCAGIDMALAEANKISIYPNPNEGQFTIKVDKPFITGTILIKNTLGQLVCTQWFDPGNCVIRIKGLSKGIYYCIVKTDNDPATSCRFELE